MSFLFDSWYVAGWSHEFREDEVLARTLLECPVVFHRTRSGIVAALADACPHRGVPLSLGRVIDDRLQCAYHGLRFDAAGACVHNPHVQGDPGRLRIIAYPVIERHGAVWIWMGDPQRADPDQIPDYRWFAPGQAEYTAIHGLLHVQASYRLVMDNLLDLSHAEYLHANTVGTPGSSRTVESSVAVEERRITVKRKVFDLPPSAVFRPVWHATATIDQQANMSWHPASNLLLDLGIMPPGGVLADGLHFPSAHLLTPETAKTTHYFYAVSRDFQLGDDALSEVLREKFIQAFMGEDRPVIEALQRNLERLPGFRPVDFTPGDAASTRAHRLLDGLLRAAKGAD